MRLKTILAAFGLLSAVAHAQVSAPSILVVANAPSGACAVNLPDRQVKTSGALYSCQNGTWTLIGGGSGTFVTLSQDAVSTATGGTTEVVGLLTYVLPSLTTGYLNWTGTAWALSPASSTTFQANGTNLSSSATVNFENSAATNGLTLGFTNPSAGNVQLTLSGTLSNAGLANSSVTIGGVSTSLGGSNASGYAFTTTSVNGVTLTAGGSASQFLNGTGAYSTPSGSGTVTASPQYDIAYYPTTGTVSTVQGAAVSGFVYGSASGAPAAATAAQGFTLLGAGTQAQMENLFSALTGCTTANYVFVAASATCVAQTGGGSIGGSGTVGTLPIFVTNTTTLGNSNESEVSNVFTVGTTGGMQVNGTGSSAITIGASGTLGEMCMGNATSGTLCIEPATGALGTDLLTIPNVASDTFVLAAATQTLTNKSIAGSEINSGTVAQGNGGTGVSNTATLTLGTSNQNWATLGTGIVKNTTTTGALSDAASSDVISLWSGTCSSTTFLRGDGSCQTPSGSGTVTASAQYDIAYYPTSGTVATVQGAAVAGFVYGSASGAPAAATAANLGALINLAQYDLLYSGGTSAAVAGAAINGFVYASTAGAPAAATATQGFTLLGAGTATQMENLFSALTGCTTANYVFVAASGTCVAQSGGSLPTSTADQTYWSNGTTGAVTSALQVFGSAVGSQVSIGTAAATAPLNVFDIDVPVGFIYTGPTSDTTINASTTTSQTTLTVVSTTGYPTSGTLFLSTAQGNTEVVTYSSITNSTTFGGVVRGKYGSTGVTHGTGDSVWLATQIVVNPDNNLIDWVQFWKGGRVHTPQAGGSAFVYLNNVAGKPTEGTDLYLVNGPTYYGGGLQFGFGGANFVTLGQQNGGLITAGNNGNEWLADLNGVEAYTTGTIAVTGSTTTIAPTLHVSVLTGTIPTSGTLTTMTVPTSGGCTVGSMSCTLRIINTASGSLTTGSGTSAGNFAAAYTLAVKAAMNCTAYGATALWYCD